MTAKAAIKNRHINTVQVSPKDSPGGGRGQKKSEQPPMPHMHRSSMAT